MTTEQPIESEAPVPTWMAFLVRHKQALLYALLVVVAGVLWFSRTAGKNERAREQDYLQAKATLQQLSTAQGDQAPALAELEAILARHNELHPKYDGPLAQAHLKGANALAARNYASPLLERTAPLATHYAVFSEGSLLIAEGQYAVALEQALALRAELRGVEAPLLRTHNLLRIALLRGELGSAEAERDAWEELLDELARGRSEPIFMRAFTHGSLSLADYAEARLRLLGASPSH